MGPRRNFVNGATSTFVLLYALLSLHAYLTPGAYASPDAPSHSHLHSLPARNAAHSRLSRTLLPRGNVAEDMKTIYERRVSQIAGSLDQTSISSIDAWVKSLDGDGKWPETQVNYTTGCAAQRALWPASVHWDRIVAMAGAYRGGIPNTGQWNGNADLRKAIGSAMEYWFKRDFKNVGCLDGGGTASCPCEDPTNSLWNTNWFSNVILIPSRVGKACLLLNGTLSASEATHCGEMTTRTYGTFAKGGGYLAGANILEIARISADAAILTNDEKVLALTFGCLISQRTAPGPPLQRKLRQGLLECRARR